MALATRSERYYRLDDQGRRVEEGRMGGQWGRQKCSVDILEAARRMGRDYLEMGKPASLLEVN